MLQETRFERSPEAARPAPTITSRMEGAVFQSLGPTELIIVLVIVIVLFGVGRIGRLGSELGSAIGAFRKGVRGADEEDDAPSKEI